MSGTYRNAKDVVRNIVTAPAVSAHTPSNGVTFVMRVPIVFTILHPPVIVPKAIAE